eukprot:gb/GECG01005585.1/.p1 GENE.gb/GECG01005585.1/~~gb/GECG01005585.1/.p1  ORF type:complete len:122 (+),score=5.70 gb/GECG01005585.1/:1-366(+)
MAASASVKHLILLPFILFLFLNWGCFNIAPQYFSQRLAPASLSPQLLLQQYVAMQNTSQMFGSFIPNRSVSNPYSGANCRQYIVQLARSSQLTLRTQCFHAMLSVQLVEFASSYRVHAHTE